MAEPDNLVLSLLRDIRTDISDFRASVDRRFAAVDSRLETVETKTDGIAVLMASAFGHLSTKISTLKDRVGGLDATRR